MSEASAERQRAIDALLVGTPGEEGPTDDDTRRVNRTGNTVYVGGDNERLLISDAHLSYLEPGGGRQYVLAEVGDVVQLTGQEAKRLDALGVTVDPDVDDEELVTELTEGLKTDEQIRTSGAEDLVAYVAQNPDERDRVRAIEEQRSQPRKTVLAATEDTPVEDDEAQREAEARQE